MKLEIFGKQTHEVYKLGSRTPDIHDKGIREEPCKNTVATLIGRINLNNLEKYQQRRVNRHQFERCPSISRKRFIVSHYQFCHSVILVKFRSTRKG